MTCVYIIENQFTKVKYVGSAKNFDKRKKQHFTMLEKGNHFNKWMQDDYFKYKDYFHMYPLFICPDNTTTTTLRDLEQGYLNTGTYKYNRSKYTSRENSEGRVSNTLKGQKWKSSSKYNPKKFGVKKNNIKRNPIENKEFRKKDTDGNWVYITK